MASLVVRPRGNASKRKEREGDERRPVGHVAESSSSMGGDREGPWSVNPSPPRRARTDPPEGYEDAVNEREKVRDEEAAERMEVDPPVDGNNDDVDVKMEEKEDEEKLNSKLLLADPVDVKMEITDAVDNAAKEDTHNPYSPSVGAGEGGGVADSMWSSRRDGEDTGNSGSRRRERARRGKPVDSWGRSSSNRDEDRSEGGRRHREDRDNHWGAPPRSGRDDQSHRDTRDSNQYSSGSRRDDRDKDSRYRDSDRERSYRPRDDDRYSSTADRARESIGGDSSRGKREERFPDRDNRRDRRERDGDWERDRDRDRERDRDRDRERDRDRDRERDRDRDTREDRRPRRREEEEKERGGPGDPPDWAASSPRQDKDEARASREEETGEKLPTINAPNPGEAKDGMDVDLPTTQAEGGGWFVQTTQMDWGALPTNEPKASADTKQADEGYRQSSHRNEEEQSRARRDGWGRDESRSTRGGDDHHSSRRRDDDLRSRSRRERDDGTRSNRDRDSRRDDRDREKDRGSWDRRERDNDHMRSRYDRERDRSRRERPGTWDREAEKDGEYDNRNKDRRRPKHQSAFSVGGEFESGWHGSQRETSPFVSELADNLGTTALSPPLRSDGEKGEETINWGADTSSAWPTPGNDENTASSVKRGLAETDPDYGKWTVSKPSGGEDNTAKRGLEATDPDYGKWTVSKPESDVSQGYVPTYSGYSSRKNDKERRPDWSERSGGRGSGRDRPRGRPRDDWVPPKSRDSGWSSRKKEDRKTDSGKSENSQLEWTGPTECVDPAGDWAGLFTGTDSKPQEVEWTADIVDPEGDWASAEIQYEENMGPNAYAAESSNQVEWTSSTVDPAGDWASAEIQYEDNWDPNGDAAESSKTATDSQPQFEWTGESDPANDWASAEIQVAEEGEPDPYEHIAWVPGVRGGGRGKYGRGRVRGPRVRKKKVRTIGLMRGFQDDPKEEEEEEATAEGVTESNIPEEPNPFWYLVEGEPQTTEDEAAKWGVSAEDRAKWSQTSEAEKWGVSS
ncbi:hypothetical protein M413DRAFT_352563 [Hebeloma cylindrosporum]|uniref:Uncharacterized protein n=1 Tax=Hebeloma cylindrosporum TaxID=76867 RepID=A0A0C2YTQ7_HEBCY|nr:hypothetical protein M413DRAFT_352563 [Hebeloma cylindrosporum h7]